MEKNTTDILRTEEMLNFALSSIPKGGKNTTFISPASEASIFNRNDSLTFREYRTKNCLQISCL